MPLINLGLNRYYHFNKLAFKIYKKFNVEIHSAKLTGGASIEDIENIILDALLNNSNASEVVNTEVQGGITEADLTFPQLVVCYDCMKRPTEVLYNVPSILKLPDNLNINKLLEILRSIVEAHPALSTSFKLKDGKVVQVYNNARDNVNFEALTLNISEQELESYKKEFVKPFDLSKGPLYRFAAVKTDNNLYLLTDFHHLVLDGASLNLFIEELAAALDGLMPEPESYDYFNYAADEKVFEQSEKFAENQKFFAAMMKNFESAAEITADLNGREENGLMKRVVSEFDFNKAEEFCRQRGITPAALYLAATAYAVSRFVNDKNIFMSTISNGRSDLRTARTYGMFVNTLPLGIDIKDETVGEFLKRSAALLSDTIEHEKYPFAKIASDYGFEPKIMYEYQIGVVSSGSALECHTFGLELTKFKLAVHIEDEGVAIYYNDALYSEELIKNLARSIVIASEAMIININKSVKSIELIDADRREVLGHFRTEAKADIKTKLYHKIIHENAIKSPDKIALIACDGKFTYKELDEITNGMAKALIENGVKPRDRAALLLPRTSRVIMSMFGVMKAGAAYIPCDPEYPAERVNHVINDSGSQFVITTADRLKDFKNAIDVETLINKSSEAPETDVAPQDLAYLIYTSGSTGKPKGVMLRHESICNYLTNHEANRHIHALASDANILLIVTTVSFDMSLKELGAALFNGLTLVFADEEHTTNPMKLAELFKQTGADAFNATPSRMLQYMELPAFREALSQCRVLMCGGEKYPNGLLDKLRKVSNARIFNTYGPTEITVSSNAKELTGLNLDNIDNMPIIPIGRPLLNVTEFIVDSDGNELPPGIVGELYVGGMGVASGYNNLPEMTAERFIEYKGMRVYKTGDYAKWTASGDVVTLGRTDNQVKLRGLRIELGEVENAIAKVAGVKNAAVKISKIRGSEHLCAYFTAENNKKIGIASIKAEISKTLTQYMIPTAWLQLDKMPMTPNGKTDLKSLPEAVIDRVKHEDASNEAGTRIL